MDLVEGTLFLVRRAGLLANDVPLEAASEVDRSLAMQIVKEVDGLPLALDQAGAFIEETPSTLAEYLALYQSAAARLRKMRGDLVAGHPSVTVTFSLAFSRLAEKNPAAAKVVRACAFLAPEAIPEEIFTRGGPKLGETLNELAANQLDFAEALREAGRFALVRRDASAKTLNIHRQVQEVLKDEMDAQTRQLWVERVVAVLADLLPPRDFRNWTEWERMLPHAGAAARHIAAFELDSEASVLLLSETALYLTDRAEYVQAEPLYQRALAIREKAFRARPPRHRDQPRPSGRALPQRRTL
jgi:hypothetical protein